MTTTIRTTCAGYKKNGDRCECPATGDDGFCFWHSPKVSPEERRAAVVKGGLMSRPKALPPETPDARLRSPESCLQLLEESVSQLRRGELDIKIMNSISYAVTTATKVWEVAISDKLDRLEKLVNGRIRRR